MYKKNIRLNPIKFENKENIFGMCINWPQKFEKSVSTLRKSVYENIETI